MKIIFSVCCCFLFFAHTRAQTPTLPCTVKVLGLTGPEIHISRKDIGSLYVLKTTLPGCVVTGYTLSMEGRFCLTEWRILGDAIPAEQRKYMQQPDIKKVYFDNIRFSCPQCGPQHLLIVLAP